MPSAGELLRRERLKRNRSLSDIASETCICSRYLVAIEEDNPKVLPGDFFHRSFIRQYASVLGLEEKEIRQILVAVGPVEDIDLYPTFSIPQEIAKVEQASKPLAHISTRVSAILLFVVLVGCSGLYAVWNRAQEAADPDLHAAVAAVASSTQSAPAPAPQSRPAGQGIPSDSNGNLPAQTAEPQKTGQMDVNLAATEKTWVSLSSKGKTVYSGVLDPSESKRFAIPEQARLLTGNAAALDVHVNGRAIGPIGLRGQVRVVLLSQNNFQILSPPKM
jgi:cytoskeletal protein RodZ